MRIPQKNPNLLESLKYYLLIKKDPTDMNSLTELSKIEGAWQAEVLNLSAKEEPGFWYTPISWHPGQAHYVYLNYPELKNILEDNKGSKQINIPNFQIHDLPKSLSGKSNKELVEDILDIVSGDYVEVSRWQDILKNWRF